MKKTIITFLFLIFCASANAQEIPYFFDKEPFIHPRIIEEFSCAFPLDPDHKVIAINLLDSNRSDRFFGDFSVEPRKDENPLVCFDEQEKKEEGSIRPQGRFCYQYIGKTNTGFHVVYASNWFGGSASYRDLLLITFEEDYGFSFDEESFTMKKDYRRLLIKKAGSMFLGDRYIGDIRIEPEGIIIGKDQGPRSDIGGTTGLWEKDRLIVIEQ